MNEALGLIEVAGWSTSMVVLDRLEKTAAIRLLQVEFNDLAGASMKIVGPLAAVRASIDAGQALANQMQAGCTATVIPNPDSAARPAWDAKPEYNPLMEQAVVKLPDTVGEANGAAAKQPGNATARRKEQRVSDQAGFAVGLIETQGFTAIFEAIDTACKAANVEVLAREKLGGGYITVVLKGDVAAVHAAVEAGKAKVEGLGKLIAAHVIPSPTKAVLSLLPK
ncbi:MAG: BMC domain-containing protein [Bryobacterales bacterium]|jgi:microcompartment protein CcmL/EutN|nr:BMC domain-containing protein [Bryobacterales bacterium]